MSMLGTTTSTVTSSSNRSVIISELVQLSIVILLGVIYLVEILHGKSPDSFISGSLVSIIGYYFGTKATVSGGNAAANAINSNANVNPTNTQGS